MWRRLAGLAKALQPVEPCQPPTETVAGYYDAHTDAYIKATGAFLQAFRSDDTDALMTVLAASMQIEDGMRVCDAGCGVGAPAIWLAQRYPKLRVECLTNSSRQFELAAAAIAVAGVSDRVALARGDYHELSAHFSARSFDRVFFLESLGHSPTPARVVAGAAALLRQGGCIYIKDFFTRTSSDPVRQTAIEYAIATINQNYVYNVMNLSALVAAIGGSGCTLAYARKPNIVPDLALTVALEHEVGRLTYPAFANVHAVDWFELLAQRD